MSIPRWLRPLIVWLLARRKGLTHKEIGARAGLPDYTVSYRLTKKELDDEEFEEMLPAVQARPAHVAVSTVLLRTLDGLDQDDGLTPEERDEIEMAALDAWQESRKVLYELVRRSRACPPLDDYPRPEDREPIRWLASSQLALLKELKTHGERLAVVRSVRKFQHWGLMEATAHESADACSRNLDEAAGWAQLAVEVAERVRGPEGWLTAVRAYAAGFGPNVLRVRGDLDKAEGGIEEARRLWQTGSDPDQVLDPGRLLGFEASLRRAQRRFPEALAALDQAAEVSHSRARVLVKKGFTLQVMGEYERAVETLLEAESLVEWQSDPQLWYKHRGNLAVLYCHVARYREAAELEEQVREVAVELKDTNELVRLTWLRGRIASGLGRIAEARSLLEQAQWEFAEKEMWYDVALALLELAALLLRQGLMAEVKALTPTLAEIFKSKKIHREALIALRFFQEAVERETVDEELVRHVLHFLFRARYDQDLRFES